MTCHALSATSPSSSKPSRSKKRPQQQQQQQQEECVEEESRSAPSCNENSTLDDGEGPIYYFGYGPIVNPIVRKRRGVKTRNEQAALLPGYRLTFACGGVVNAIRQRGYEVMGVLMQFDTRHEWVKFQEYDAGYDVEQVLVYPLEEEETIELTAADDHDDSDDPLEHLHARKPVKAYAFLMDPKHSGGDKMDGPLERRLPQERYLKLIAAGMRGYHIDEEYIQDQIMSVPYLPTTKPQDYKTFPQSRNGQPLPTITFRRYQNQLCSGCSSSSPSRSAPIFFIVGTKVVRVDPPSDDPNHPGVIWLRKRAHGQPDSTLTLHQTVVDPDLVMVDTTVDLTPQHVAWAENHFKEWLEQGGLRATAVFQLSTAPLDDNHKTNSNRPSRRRSSLARLMQHFGFAEKHQQQQQELRRHTTTSVLRRSTAVATSRMWGSTTTTPGEPCQSRRSSTPRSTIPNTTMTTVMQRASSSRSSRSSNSNNNNNNHQSPSLLSFHHGAPNHINALSPIVANNRRFAPEVELVMNSPSSTTSSSIVAPADEEEEDHSITLSMELLIMQQASAAIRSLHTDIGDTSDDESSNG